MKKFKTCFLSPKTRPLLLPSNLTLFTRNSIKNVHPRKWGIKLYPTLLSPLSSLFSYDNMSPQLCLILIIPRATAWEFCCKSQAIAKNYVEFSYAGITGCTHITQINISELTARSVSLCPSYLCSDFQLKGIALLPNNFFRSAEYYNPFHPIFPPFACSKI